MYERSRPFSLLIIDGPSTTRTSATSARGICNGGVWLDGPAEAMDAPMPPALMPPIPPDPAASPPIPRAENLDRDRQPHAGCEHLDPVGDRLGETVAPAGHLQGRAHLLDNVRLGLLPEQEPGGERLVQLRAQGRQLARSRLPCDQLPI